MEKFTLLSYQKFGTFKNCTSKVDKVKFLINPPPHLSLRKSGRMMWSNGRMMWSCDRLLREHRESNALQVDWNKVYRREWGILWLHCGLGWHVILRPCSLILYLQPRKKNVLVLSFLETATIFIAIGSFFFGTRYLRILRWTGTKTWPNLANKWRIRIISSVAFGCKMKQQWSATQICWKEQCYCFLVKRLKKHRKTI